MLDILLLVVCIVLVFASILYIFFLNRVVGYLIGLFIRLSYWNQDSSKVWVEIESVHLSLLAGRVLLKNAQYHSSNQSIRLVRCSISWRYWIRNAAEEEDLTTSKLEGEHAEAKYQLPCRIHVTAEGMEWFLYNRTAAYDDILSHLDGAEGFSGKQYASLSRSRASTNAHEPRKSTDHPRESYREERPTWSGYRTPILWQDAVKWVKRQLPQLDPKYLLPFTFEASKAAIICGNPSTKSLLLSQFTKAEGTYGIVQPRSQCDQYKQMLRIRFINADISLVDNEDYRTTMPHLGKELKEYIEIHENMPMHGRVYLFFRNFHKLWSRYGRKFGRKIQEDYHHNHRQKLGRKRRTTNSEEESHIGADFTKLEYAIERVIIETPALDLTYYVDVVGAVPISGDAQPHNPADPFDVGNGDLPPEWGLDLVLNGGTIRYGPWADRQRAELQSIFFPSGYRTAAATSTLSPGDSRLWTAMKVFIEFRNNVSWHIPFREASKNWQWDGVVNIPHASKQREAAFLQLKLGDKSTMKYIVPMVANHEGYLASLEASADSFYISSSLNDMHLLYCDSWQMSGHLPSPLRWDQKRHWTFGVTMRSPVFFLLRDHINMITDLVKDWVSGPPPDFHRHIPMLYLLRMQFEDYQINMYANDHNIVDRPLHKDENVLFTWQGKDLSSTITIPSDEFRPESICVPFTVDAPDIRLKMTLPRWNTHALSAPSHIANIGRVGRFILDGSFTYFSEVRPDYVDQLKLDFRLVTPAVKFFGWVVRHFMVWRDNYFGTFTQFSTTQEYTRRRNLGIPVGDALEDKYRKGHSNIFQVEMDLRVENGGIVMPATLFGFERAPIIEGDEIGLYGLGPCTIYKVTEVQVHIRLHDFFMEMSVNTTPLSLSIENDCVDSSFFSDVVDKNRKEVLTIDGLEITANRLFGPQPRTTTYVAIWDLHIGRIRSAMTIDELDVFLTAGKSFGSNFSDPFNAPAAEFSPPGAAVPDAAFYTITFAGVESICLFQPSAVRVSIPVGFQIKTNDLATAHYRKLVSVRLSKATVSALMSHPSKKRWMETASVEFAMNMDLYRMPAGWRQDASEQKRFLTVQDLATGRAQRLCLLDSGKDRSTFPVPLLAVDPPRWTRSAPTATPNQASELANRGDAQLQSSNSSDSDNDLSGSGIDWDLRLAQSKPRLLSPLRGQDHGSESLTSGDESDEVSSPGHSPVHHHPSDSEDDGDSTGKILMARFLDGFSRQFNMVEDHRQVWKMTLLSVAQDHRPLLGVLAEGLTSHGLQPADHLNYQPGKELDAFDRSVLRLSTIGNTMIFITPAVAEVLSCLVESLDRHKSSPELFLDDLISDNINSSDKSPSHLVIDAMLTPAHVILTQDIMSHDDDQNINGNKSLLPRLSEGRPKRIVSTIEFAFSAGHAFCSIPNGLSPPMPSTFFTTHFTNLSMAMKKLHSDSRHGRRQSLSSAVFTFGVDLITGRLQDRRIKVGFGDTASSLRSSAIEVVMASTQAAVGHCSRIMNCIEAYRRGNKHKKAALVHRLLQQSHLVKNRDLLSTIQPSFLVQAGRPDRLRHDTTWKFLYQLRDSLRFLSVAERQLLNVSDEIFSIPDEEALRSYPAYEERLVDGEYVYPMDVPVFRKMYGYLTKGGQTQDQSVQGMSFCMTQFTATHDEPSSSQKTQIRVESFSVQIQRSHRRFMTLTASSQATLGNHLFPKPASTDSEAALVAITVNSVLVHVFPTTIDLFRRVLTVRRVLGARPHKQDPRVSLPQKPTSFKPIVFEVQYLLRSFSVQVAAENLIVAFSLRDFTFSTFCALSSPFLSKREATLDVSLNQVASFKEISVEAHEAKKRDSVGDLPKRSSLLAAFVVAGGRISFTFRREAAGNMGLRGLISVQNIDLSVPRSALRLYHFIEQWRGDYLPGIKSALEDLLKELRKSPKDRPSPSKESFVSQFTMIQVQGSLGRVGLTLQVMLGTWLSCKIEQSTFYIRNSARLSRARNLSFGLQLGSQTLSIVVGPNPHPTSGPGIHKTSAVLVLPTFHASGIHHGDAIETLVLLESLHVTVKPKHWDALLSVQQKFGQDFNDLLHLISESRSKRKGGPSPSIAAQRNRDIHLAITGRLRGFRIGLQGASTTQFLECDDIDATFENANGVHRWKVKLNDLSLYLSPRSLRSKDGPSLDRQRCSAFIATDVTASNQSSTGSSKDERCLSVCVTKVHAVMQPSSIGELGDFIDQLQVDILLRQEERASELKEFKDKARSLMRAFNVAPSLPVPESRTSFLDNRLLEVDVSNLGIAFPLSYDRAVRIPTSPPLNASTVNAFLFSISRISFRSHKGEKGQAKMTGFSFQFISRFRQSVAADFVGSSYSTRNRLLYPEMTARLHTNATSSKRQLIIAASVSGFILDLDPGITSYVFSLIDVYRHGRNRVEKLAAAIAKSNPDQRKDLRLDGPGPISNRRSPTTNIKASFNFLSGKVRMHKSSSRSLSRDPGGRVFSFSKRREDQLLESESDVFSLPEVSVWSEYRATPTIQTLIAQETPEPSILVFKSTIHSSQNMLRPSLLPFITEIIHNIEERMRKTASESPTMSSSMTMKETISQMFTEESAIGKPPPSSSLKITFSLRIDQSKLELTCRPDVNVVARLHWQSGGFIINVSPGARRVSVTGSVAGLTAGIKHGFLTDDCARLDARDLNFTVNFDKASTGSGEIVNLVSVVVDTEVSGCVRFPRLQDILCFKAVWLDNMPILTRETSADADDQSGTSTPADQEGKQGFATGLVIRARNIDIECDLGQAISVATLKCDKVLVRTRLTEVLSELTVSVQQVELLANGSLSGELKLPNFDFETIRKRQDALVLDTKDDDGKLLQLTITSGALDVAFQSDSQWLLEYRAEPMTASVHDDWTRISSTVSTMDGHLGLHFNVLGSKAIGLITVGTLPKLVTYAGKFQANLEVQRQGASRESATFRAVLERKPTNVLTDVAHAMLQNARTKLHESRAEKMTYTVKQFINLELDEFIFAVFPRMRNDIEVARFVGRNLQTHLAYMRNPQNGFIQRDLQLSLSHMSISQLVRYHVDARTNPQQPLSTMLSAPRVKGAHENVIFSLPSMVMSMSSREDPEDVHRRLFYDFNSKFTHLKGQKDYENINISFDLGLYSWLTSLQKSFNREFKNAQESAGLKQAQSLLPSLSISTEKRRETEPVAQESTKDASLAPPLLQRAATTATATRNANEPPPTSGPSTMISGTSHITAEPSASSPKSPESTTAKKAHDITYVPGKRSIERLTVRQLGDATPDVMHPFFAKRAGFNLEESMPQYVHEYATTPVEELMKALVKVYTKQLKMDKMNEGHRT